MNAKSRTIDLGHDVRLFTTAQKQALLVEARGHCTTTGCDAPYPWLQADHRHPHSRGGPTNLDQGQIKCSGDNHRKADHPTNHHDRITTHTDTDRPSEHDDG